MARTPPRQFRLEDEVMRQIDELAAEWGGTMAPTPRTAVIRTCVAREYARVAAAKARAEAKAAAARPTARRKAVAAK